MVIIQAPGLLLLKPFQSSPSPFRNLPPPSIPSQPSLSLTSTAGTPRKLLTPSCSLLDDGLPGSAIKAFGVDPMLAVKKKATNVSPGLKGTSIYLVGINSSLKTTLGKLLADALRYYFFDSDHLVVEAAGGEAGAKQLLDMDEVGFRESETEVLRQLSAMGRLVVCAGDGAVQSTTNLYVFGVVFIVVNGKRSLLRHGISIWVDVPLDVVAKEVVEGIGSEGSSSASHSEVLSEVAIRYEEMQGGYAIADARVSLQKVAGELGYEDVEAVSTEEMGLEVLMEIEKLIRAKKMMEEAARPF